MSRVLATLCLVLMAAGVHARASQVFDIPAQDLAVALETFAKQADKEVFFDREQVRGKQSVPVKGNLEPVDALHALLGGAGLTVRRVNEQTFVVGSAVAAQGANKNESMELAQVDGAGSMQRVSSPEHEDNSGKISEIVVTAQKREERLIDTPQSVSVVSADMLAKIGATQFRDFADTVPGLSFQTAGPGFTQVTLRGVTTGTDVGPTVGVYVDEVPYGSSSAFSLGAQQALDVGLFDIQRIEVLRGPQGTLYGASTMGGLIKYVSRQPSTDLFGVRAQLGTAGTQSGSFGYNAALAVNMPLAENKAALRASGFYMHTGGFVDNIALRDSDADSSNIYGGRLDFLASPTDALSIRLGAYAQDVNRDGNSTVEYTAAGEPQFGGLNQSRLFQEPSNVRFRLASGTLAYDFGGATLTSISSYQTAKSDSKWDISAVYVPVLQAFLGRTYGSVRYPFDTRTDKFTQELRLSSKIGERLEWALGGFYTREKSRWHEEFVLLNPAGNVTPNDVYEFKAPSRYTEIAGFGDLTWHLTKQLSLTGGLRYANDRQVFTQIGSGQLVSSVPTAHSDEDVTTYLANLRYQFADRANLYLRYATGYRPGGPNPAANDANGNPLGSPTFDADRLKSYELGYKAETADRRFGIDLAGYRIDWDNIQVLAFLGGFAFRVNAAGGATVNGAELSLTARPLDVLTLSSAVAWQDATLSEAEPTLGAGAVKGERLPNVPRFTASLTADVALPAGGAWGPTIGASVRRVGERRTAFGASAYRLPEYTCVDLRAGARFGMWDAQLYLRNLFNERGQLSSIFPQFGNRIAILQPLTAGLNLTTQF